MAAAAVAEGASRCGSSLRPPRGPTLVLPLLVLLLLQQEDGRRSR